MGVDLRVRGRWRGVLELEHEVVQIAVVPVLTRLEGTNDGVMDGVEMSGGVSTG
jgi:hypothetical protein